MSNNFCGIPSADKKQVSDMRYRNPKSDWVYFENAEPKFLITPASTEVLHEGNTNILVRKRDVLKVVKLNGAENKYALFLNNGDVTTTVWWVDGTVLDVLEKLEGNKSDE